MSRKRRPMQTTRHTALLACILPLTLALVILLTACGATTTNGANVGGATTTSPTQTISSQTATPALRTCAGPPASVNSAGTPTVVIDESTPNHTASAHIGDLVQVRLPSSLVWSFSGATGNLTLMQPGNLQDTSLDVCFWNFHAASAGTTTLTFAGHVPCAPNTICSAAEIAQSFTVHVS